MFATEPKPSQVMSFNPRRITHAARFTSSWQVPYWMPVVRDRPWVITAQGSEPKLICWKIDTQKPMVTTLRIRTTKRLGICGLNSHCRIIIRLPPYSPSCRSMTQSEVL